MAAKAFAPNRSKVAEDYDGSTAATEATAGLLAGARACRLWGYFRNPGGFGRPQTTGIVVNALTGLAISGFDPVAYFVDAKPKMGRPDMELRLDGAVWRFQNEGNRAAFADHPEVYTPRFGGYDPVAIARGVSVPGHPLFWAVTGERLYLFYQRRSAHGLPGRSGPHHRQRASANGPRSRAPSRAEPFPFMP